MMTRRSCSRWATVLVFLLGFYSSRAAFGDIVINELLPDPTPVVGLPEKEFVEIFNTTNSSINLAGWKLSDGTTTITLSSYSLPSNGYLILCSNADVAAFSAFGPALGVGTLPSLNNSGDNISLTDNSSVLTDFFAYTPAYFQDGAKDDGGYTLERVNPFIACSGLNNWRASDAGAGGTPGTQNSIYDDAASLFTPKLLAVSVSGTNLITVQYDDAMEAGDIASFYTLSGGTISSASANAGRDMDSLSLAAAIDPGTVYSLSISGRKNCAGIALPDTNILIALGVEGTFLDLVFTEFMADPTPLVGLPDAEYLEIHNRTDKPINLSGCDLADGSGSVTLDNLVILPNDYLVLTTTSAAPLFSNPKVKGIAGFPSLTNAGEQLALYNASDELLHSIQYSDSWHANSVKKDGGWSLEMIDTDNPCVESGNWTSSNAVIGGTPGSANSVAGTLADEKALSLLEVQVVDITHIGASFSKKISPASLSGSVFNVDNGVGAITAVTLQRPSLTSVALALDNPIEAGTIYTLSVTGLSDCTGNIIGSPNTGKFALPQNPEPGDLIINEVLFNPRTNGYDFVELYNWSDKALSSGSLAIAEKDILTGEITEFSTLSSTNKLLFPGDYLVLTENQDAVKLQYITPAPGAFLNVSAMPNWPDDEGIVSLMRAGDMEVLDELEYSNDWHYKLLDDEDGVSLERINPEKPTQDPGNWHSAAQSAGFATPGYKNSSFLNPGISEGFTLEPEVFSPDQDGFEDILAIQYAFDKPGNLLNIYIFDTDGRRVSHLVKNETVGQEGFYTWDGINDDGTRARVGIYIIVMEATDIAEGKVKRMKGKCVVAAKL